MFNNWSYWNLKSTMAYVLVLVEYFFPFYSLQQVSIAIFKRSHNISSVNKNICLFLHQKPFLSTLGVCSDTAQSQLLIPSTHQGWNSHNTWDSLATSPNSDKLIKQAHSVSHIFVVVVLDSKVQATTLQFNVLSTKWDLTWKRHFSLNFPKAAKSPAFWPAWKAYL